MSEWSGVGCVGVGRNHCYTHCNTQLPLQQHVIAGPFAACEGVVYIVEKVLRFTHPILQLPLHTTMHAIHSILTLACSCHGVACAACAATRHTSGDHAQGSRASALSSAAISSALFTVPVDRSTPTHQSRQRRWPGGPWGPKRGEEGR